jgi:hypothetical protein
MTERELLSDLASESGDWDDKGGLGGVAGDAAQLQGSDI